jgi:hypothetical protein
MSLPTFTVPLNQQLLRGRLGCGPSYKINYAVLGHDELSKEKGAPVQKGGSHIFQMIPKNGGLTNSKRSMMRRKLVISKRRAQLKCCCLLPRPRRALLLSEKTHRRSDFFASTHPTQSKLKDTMSSIFWQKIMHR